VVSEPKLVGWTPMVTGLFAVVLGGLWTLQGLDVVGGSVMSGVSLWAVVGPIVAVGGLALIVVGVRRRSRAKLAEEQASSE
jgi:hypothetical protein